MATLKFGGRRGGSQHGAFVQRICPSTAEHSFAVLAKLFPSTVWISCLNRARSCISHTTTSAEDRLSRRPLRRKSVLAEDRFGRVPLRPRTVSADDFFGRGPLRERIVSAEDRFGRGPLRQGTAKEQPWSSRGGPGAAREQPGAAREHPEPATSSQWQR